MNNDVEFPVRRPKLFVIGYYGWSWTFRWYLIFRRSIVPQFTVISQNAEIFLIWNLWSVMICDLWSFILYHNQSSTTFSQMRQLARPQLQLCLGATGGGSDCGAVATEQQQRSRHHSSSSRSPVSSPRQKQQSPVVTLATGGDLYAPVAGGARSPSISGGTGSLMGGTGGGRRCSGTPRGRVYPVI